MGRAAADALSYFHPDIRLDGQILNKANNTLVNGQASHIDGEETAN
jgi:hypothetical protein